MIYTRTQTGLLCLSLGLAVVACKSEEKVDLPTNVKAAERVVKVPTQKVEKLSGVLTVLVTGTSRALREADLAPAVPGRVQRIYVEAGKNVKKGQTLVQLDGQSARLAAAQAKASAAASRAQADQADADYQRLKPLASSGSVNASRIEQLKSQRKTSDASAKAAEAAAAAAQSGTANSTIKAPFDGTVVEMKVEVGEMASGGAVVRLFDLSELEVSVRISERELTRLKDGTPAKVRFPTQDVEVEGIIKRIGLDVDSATRTVEVVVGIPNPDRKLRSGLFAEVEFTPSASRKAIVVPASAIAGTEEPRSCFLVVDGCAVGREVRIQAVNERSVEILSGLKEGDVIVADHVSRVLEGDKVEATAATPTSKPAPSASAAPSAEVPR